MLNPDERDECLSIIKTAHQALEFYKVAGEKEKERLRQSTFGLGESMIQVVAKRLNLSTPTFERREEKSKINRERHARIKELEEAIMDRQDLSTVRSRIEKIEQNINQKMIQNGFKKIAHIKLTTYGLDVHICLGPIRESWDIDYDIEEEDERFKASKRAFVEQGFLTWQEGEQIVLLDKDVNKEKIATLLHRLFPTAEIYKWETRRVHHEVFSLGSVELVFRQLDEFDGGNE